MQVAVFGMGYVGSVTAVCLAANGHTVAGVDVAHDKVLAINAGRSPLVEPGLADLIATAVDAGKLRATTEQAESAEWADIILLTVGTPTAPDGSTDLSHLLQVCEVLASVIARSSSPKTVVVRSTVPPGTVDRELIPTLEALSGKRHGVDFVVVFCPEFLRESVAIADFNDPPFTVIGAREEEHAKLAQQLLAFLHVPVFVVDIATAECLKYACNAFHALKVAFANELARVFHTVGADPRAVMALFIQDRELNISPKYLRPGFAYGGSCLPKDLRALQHMSKDASIESPLLKAIADSNDEHIQAAMAVVEASGAKRIALLGLTFKSATDDMRESPYVALASDLARRGYELRIFDPVVSRSRPIGGNKAAVDAALPDLSIYMCDTPADALKGADLAVLGSSNADICELLLEEENVRILDLRGDLPPVVEAGLRSRADDSGAPLFAGVAW